MFQESMEVFEKMLQKNGERLVVDVQVPKDGTYRLVELSDEGYRIVKTLDVKNDKKNDQIIGEVDGDYSFIRTLDYYSKLVAMNKPMDPAKLIHTNNYMAFGVKKENVLSEKITPTVIQKYYEILKNPMIKYAKKPKTRTLYERVLGEIGEPDRDLITKIETLILSGEVMRDIALDKKEYVKIFFVFPDREKTLELYKQENRRYMIPNIYNNNEFNEVLGGEIFGVPNNNMGMNSEKTFLEHKSRKIKAPYLVNQKEAVKLAQLFDYFMGMVSRGRRHIYIDHDEYDPQIRAYTNKEEPQFLDSGYYMLLKKEEDEVSVQQAGVISRYNPRLVPPFWLKNYMGIPEKLLAASKISYKAYDRLWEVRGLMDSIFFDGRLANNPDTEAKDISVEDQVVKRCIVQYRQCLNEWFYQGQKKKVSDAIDRFTLELICNSIRKGETFKAQRQFNLRYSLQDYFAPDRKRGEKMENVRAIFREHINLPKEEEWAFVSDEEYAFAVGQAVSYLMSLSKANVKTGSMVNPFLNAKNVKVIQQRLLQMYQKYNYCIAHYASTRIRQILSHILEYEPKKICREEIMHGFVAANLVYEKKQVESEDEVNE